MWQLNVVHDPCPDLKLKKKKAVKAIEPVRQMWKWLMLAEMPLFLRTEVLQQRELASCGVCTCLCRAEGWEIAGMERGVDGENKC